MTLKTLVQRYRPLWDGTNDGGAGGSPDASSTPPSGGAAAPAPGVASSSPPAPAASSPPVAATPGTPSVPDDVSPPADAFAGMDGDDLDLVEIPEGDTGPQPDDGVKPPVVPLVAPVVAAVPPVQPPTPVQPPVQPVAVAPAAPQQGLPPASEIAEIVQGLETHGKALAGHIATTTFALSKEEADALEVNAVGEIPKLMARVHLEASKNTLRQIETFVPKIVESLVNKILQTRTASTEALADFYKAWPGLSSDKHQKLVDQYAKVFRATNPQATRKDAIAFVGAAIHAQLGLPVQVAAPGSNGQTPPPFAPARPGARQVSTLPVDDLFGGLGQNLDEG